MGHATRILAVVLLAAGFVLIGRYFFDGALADARSAPFTTATDGEPATAIFTPDASHPGSGELRIELVEIAPTNSASAVDRIRVTVGSSEEEFDLRVGNEVRVGDKSYRVSDVRTWQGLLPVPNGAQMVSVSAIAGDGTALDNLLMSAGQRLDINAELSIALYACADRDDALAQIAAARNNLGKGRWGIADANGVIWFEGFTPGAGARLMDGSLVTLETFDVDGPTLIVRKRGADGDALLRVDGASNEPPLLLEYGDDDADAVSVFVTEDGRAMFAAGASSAPAGLTPGETWAAPGDYTLRLEQALRSAAPVRAEDSPFFEAVLEGPGARVRVRQGEAVRVGDALLRYVRAADNATAAFRLRIARFDAMEDETLVPGHEVEFDWGGSRWRLAHADLAPGEHVTIRRAHVERGPLLAGAACLVAALALVALLRRRAAN